MEEKRRLRRSVYYPIALSLFLWLIKAIELLFSLDFTDFGILPRTLTGSKGILFSGFIHGDILHLMSNTVPLVLLGATILYFYDKLGPRILLGLYLSTGLVVWVFARPAYHIGASGLVYGMLSFLFVGGFIRRDRQSLAISLVILVLYGGSMFSGLFPAHPHVSWESHLIGFILGVIAAIYFRKISMKTENDKLQLEHEPQKDMMNNMDYTIQEPKNSDTLFVYHYKQKVDKPD